VDTAADVAAMLELGVDGVMTDRPAMLRDVLTARELWPAR
jgi:glycerophosphoryl diester phosphodiesterase